MAENVTQTLFGNRDLRKDEGWAQELQHLVDLAATQVVGHVKTTASSAGMPWGSAKLRNNAEVLARIKEFDDPAKAVKFQQLSDHAIITAAIDAIRRIKQAKANGEWEEQPAMLDGEMGTFSPATIQPGFVAGTVAAPPSLEAPGPQAQEAPTSLPAQMPLPGMGPTGQV